MSASGTIRITAARELLSAVTKRRPEYAEFSARAGVSRETLQASSGTIPLATFTSMLEAAAYETGNGSLGLELGKTFRFSALGPIARLLETAPTLGAALEQFTRHFGSIQTNTHSALYMSDGSARLVYSINDPAVRFRNQDAAFTLAVEYSMLANLVGPAWEAAGIDFEQSASADLPFYQEHFDCPLRFGCENNAIVFPTRLLDAPMRDMDRVVNARIAADLAETTRYQTVRLDLIESIEAWVTASLCRTVSTDMELVASDFGMSARTFQRALSDHGVHYLGIRNKVRSHIAKCLLAETNLPVTAIALQLGYSETSAFSRGFKTLVGETPLDFRRRSNCSLHA